MGISRAEAAREILRRRAARSSLLHFTKFTFPQYQAEEAHALLAGTLDRVIAGDIRRLMIFAPPQHGKSELASVRLPAFWAGRRLDDPIILTSYAASLAFSKSRQARSVVESQEFSQLFGVRTHPASRAVDHWELAGHRGGLVAAGVGGPITGHGALLGIIDDPFENWAQAQSERTRDNVWEWYRSTFRTRIWEEGAIILIMTRWHEDDLAGRLLAHDPGAWTVLRLPALAESQAERDDACRRLGLAAGQPDPLGRQPGEALCPGRFSEQALAEIAGDVGTYVWYAEYQGTPRALEGNRFKRSWFEIVRAAPRLPGQLVRYWDKGGTRGAGAFTAGVLIGYWGQVYIVLDVVRGQWSAGEREVVIRQTAELDRARWGEVEVYVEQEPGSGGKESAENTIKNLAGFAVFADRPTGSKDVRAEPFAAQAEAGNVKLLEGAWNHAYIEELAAFPNGAYMDQVDASSGAFNRLVLKPKYAAPGTVKYV